MGGAKGRLAEGKTNERGVVEGENSKTLAEMGGVIGEDLYTTAGLRQGADTLIFCDGHALPVQRRIGYGHADV